MEWTARIRFTASQKAELWERWQGGQCMADIARALDRILVLDSPGLRAKLSTFGKADIGLAGAEMTAIGLPAKAVIPKGSQCARPSLWCTVECGWHTVHGPTQGANRCENSDRFSRIS